jgi:hypothetical protein
MNSSLNPDDADRSCWFVLLDNLEKGPLTARTIHQYYRFNRVTDDTMVRKDGSTEWSHIRDLPELLALLARMNLERFSSIPPAASTVSISIAPPPIPVPSVAPAALPTTVPIAPPVALPFASSPRRRPQSNRALLVTSTGFFLVSLAVLGVLLFRDNKKEEGLKACEPQPVKTIEKIVEKIVYRDCVPNESANREEGANTELAANQTDIHTADTRGKSARKKKSADDKTKELMAQMGVSTPSLGAPVGNFGKSSVESSQKAHSNGLDSQEMKHVVDVNRGSLKNCYERSLKKGESPAGQDLRVNFQVIVGTSGIVKKVSLSGEGARMPILKDCLTQSVRKWVFPALKQESTLEFPFVFTPMS